MSPRFGSLKPEGGVPPPTPLDWLFAQPLYVSVKLSFSTVHSRRAEKRADRGPREEGPGGVLSCTLRSPDNRERRDATLIGTALACVVAVHHTSLSGKLARKAIHAHQNESAQDRSVFDLEQFADRPFQPLGITARVHQEGEYASGSF